MNIVRSIGGVLAGLVFSLVFGSLTSYLTVYYLHVTYSVPGPDTSF